MILHSQIIGSGKPFVILHGFLGMSDNWKTLGNQFSEAGFEVHLVDQRNHGRSFNDPVFTYNAMVADLMEYLSHHNLEDVILLGHSMGGKTAMEFAVQHPERVNHLIVADIAPKYYPPHHQEILAALNALNFSALKSRTEAEEVLAKDISDEGIRLFLLKNLYRKSKEEFGLRVNLPVVTQQVEQIGVALTEGTVYDGPTLFLSGENSPYIHKEDAALIEAHFPKASIKTVHRAGHWLHAENPKEFYELTMNFLETASE